MLNNKNVYKILITYYVKMKTIFVIIDGLADRPHKKLGGKTPLEKAKTPNLDYFASNGKLGSVWTVKEGFVPGTSEGVISLLGKDWKKYPRGWLEALGAGLDLERGDLALRANFATIDNLDNKKIKDRRAGRDLSTKEAQELAEPLNVDINLPVEFQFEPTLQHRGVLVFRGGFSDNITPTDPEYIDNKEEEMEFSIPEDDDSVTEYSADILNRFTRQAHDILNEHPINVGRMEEGKLPANIILSREPGIEVEFVDDFKDWICSTDVPVIKGIAKSLGMNLIEYEAGEFEKKEDPYEDLKENLEKSIAKNLEMIENNMDEYEHFLVYLKETDTPGHDNRPDKKKEMVELIDKKFFSKLRKIVDKKFKILVSCDHATPCELEGHSSDKVPVLLCDWTGNKERKFSEKEASKGELDIEKGAEIMRLLK